MRAAPQPPALDELVGDWMAREDLVHLHSLRNQWGQAHVNADLTSLSWLAIPPFVGGYHTGVLRVDGRVRAADRSRWAPWGVTRDAVFDRLRVSTETRLAYEADRVLWRVTVTNEAAEPRTVTLEQELGAPVAHSEVDWGWTYGLPWNHGHHHDYFATERVRAEALADRPRQVQLLPHDLRAIRLGSPRVPGIQRDEDDAPMLLEASLPDHSTSDSGRTRASSIVGVVRSVTIVPVGSDAVVLDGPYVLDNPASEHVLDAVGLADGTSVCVSVEVATSGQTGVILTHGNHPDSLQLGLDGDRPFLVIGGERVVADRPLAPGRHAIEARVTADGASLVVDGSPAGATRPWWHAQRWSASVDGTDAVVVADSGSPAVSAYALSPAPSALVADGSRGIARWDLHLAPGETGSVAFVLEIGLGPDVVPAARAEAARFGAALDEVAARWRTLWANAFVPGNPDHSGYLPVLSGSSDGLSTTYYLGILLALYLRNTGVSDLGPVFLTGGPRLGPTTTYYWDLSEWPRTAAMLEPAGLRSWILAALAQDYDASHSFDVRNLLPVGNHYASNDHALFRIVQGYVATTGDTALLDEVAGGRTVLDHLRRLAFRPRTRRSAFGAGVLVDLGDDAWELLECVPNYRHAVVSFNAGYVGMLRSLASLLRTLGADDEADEAARDADELAAAVLGQYAGGGRWRIAHPTGEDVIGHCLDFELVAADLTEDLSAAHRREMVEFATTHLIDGEWMRALSPDDPIAPFSDRPDHGAAGAFAAWPGATSYGLCRLGRPDLAVEFLSRVHRSRGGALWGQAVESVGGGRYRVAERGISNRESVAAVAVTEAVLAGVFGLQPEFASLGRPVGTLSTTFGELHGVRAVGFDLPVPERSREPAADGAS
ncbi:hypothetical protein ACPPVS_11665 [Cellulomonas sp. McL0617]|uniref:hypothetical protein n=1 Tax=Cellulomonas sp. McL0617 TaxID=3415675 RepID=UPI003CE9385E